jgi:dTDP-4-dehydrorhamnose 3,5-epimerase
MKITKTKLPGALIISPDIFGDNRGWFYEPYNKKRFAEHGLKINFVQDSCSFSAKKNTVRGLHFQKNPHAQAKLIWCARGKVLDVIVDLRQKSPTYKKWLAVELSGEDKKQVFIPKGFAHGFLTLTDNVEMQYKVNDFYSPNHETTIRYNDPELAIKWGISKPVLSKKDAAAPDLKNCKFKFR